MKILSISDIVEPKLRGSLNLDDYRNIELVLACGDLAPEYLSDIAITLDVPLYYVRGNHDIRYGPWAPRGCTDIHGRLIDFNGIRILGLEGSRWYNGGPFQYTEMQMRAMIFRLRPRIWLRGQPHIIVTHAPPRHVHDREDRCHKGFKIYNWMIRKYSPRYFIHGHIHRNFTQAAQRETVVGGTRVINTYGHFIFEYENRPMA